MSTDIDIAQITEALNDKADIGLGNTIDHLTTTAKSYFAGIGMISTRYIDLSLEASGTEYTAPTNGWVYVSWNNVTSDGGGSSLDIQNPAVCTYATSTSWQRHCLPVQKGQKFRVYYGSASGRTLNIFRFYYAEGEK